MFGIRHYDDATSPAYAVTVLARSSSRRMLLNASAAVALGLTHTG